VDEARKAHVCEAVCEEGYMIINMQRPARAISNRREIGILFSVDLEDYSDEVEEWRLEMNKYMNTKKHVNMICYGEEV